MYPLFESIKVIDGKIQNIDWHQIRYQRSFEALYNKRPVSHLINNINIPSEFHIGVFKLRISYNDRYKKVEFQPYIIKQIKTLKIVIDNDIKYGLKYSNRDKLIAAYNQRSDCDDVLIIKNGEVTDSSYSSIVFFTGTKWVTPTDALLKGTTQARLIEQKIIEEQKIGLKDIPSFKSFKLVNALRDFNDVEQSDISNIAL